MSSKANTSRRNFIKALGLGSAAAVTAVAITKPEVMTDRSAAAKGPRSGKGYQETARVRQYYRTARV